MKNQYHNDPDEDNKELLLARDYVENTGCHVFLTGRAGTGKTTFLKKLKKESDKRLIVTAPTGVAAINAGGVTLHSFFQLPFGPYIPGSDSFIHNKERLFRFSKEKKQIIQSLDLLIIDEISMVRADVLDAVDMVLQHHRRNRQPFGGVQLLLIGDLFQLPPVAKSDEWGLLSQYYQSVYFFSSHALNPEDLITIELKKVYRQQDEQFIELLNQVRDNRLDTTAVERLNQQVVTDLNGLQDKGHIILTTHNKKADAVNAEKLNALPARPTALEAEINGDFPEFNYPTFVLLVLKIDAQVMFLRNDMSPEKKYYNGKIGRVVSISQDAISVKCADDPEPVTLEPVEWENIKYTVNEQNLEIEEEVLGRFKQFPLKPAWAITIHKSQGLTFDHAVIDAQNAFAQGQVYVALSRCRSLEGLALSSPMPRHGIPVDKTVSNFIAAAPGTTDIAERLLEEKVRFEQKLVIDCFDFKLLNNRMGYFFSLILNNSNLVQVSGITDIKEVSQAARTDIVQVGEKFRRQLVANIDFERLPSTDAYVRERVVKASQWFGDKLSTIFDEVMNHFSIETDNKTLGRKIKNAHQNLQREIFVKTAGIRACSDGFSLTAYLKAVSKAPIEFQPARPVKSAAPSYTQSDISHPELFNQLKEWRLKLAKEKGVPAFHILHQRVLIQITVTLPQHVEALKTISGVGPKTISNYGEDILELVKSYRKSHGIKDVVLPEPKLESKEDNTPKEKKPKPDTRQVSYDLFNKGLEPGEIAKERGLVENTIKKHLAGFIEKGQIEIDRLVSKEKQDKFFQISAKQEYPSLSLLKKALGDEFSYGDIQLMQAHLKFKEQNDIEV